MSNPAFREKIIAILADLGELEDAKRADLLSAPEQDIEFVAMSMDSLAALDLCVNLEDATGRTVEPADLVSHPSINRLAAHLDAGGGVAR
jgi:acyl carrier protein